MATTNVFQLRTAPAKELAALTATDGTFRFHFDDLPTKIEDGFEAGLVKGSAEVRYFGDEGIWFVHEIYLTGYRRATPEENAARVAKGLKPVMYITRDVEIDPIADEVLYLAIWQELTDGSFKDNVQEAVNEKIAEDADVAGDPN